jgi:hypothetical protein
MYCPCPTPAMDKTPEADVSHLSNSGVQVFWTFEYWGLPGMEFGQLLPPKQPSVKEIMLGKCHISHMVSCSIPAVTPWEIKKDSYSQLFLLLSISP